MPTLDTNVLLRFLVRDDPKQTRIVEQFISKHLQQDSALFIPLTVVLETEWVLRSLYSFPKESVLEVFVGLLETREMLFQDEAIVERAVYLFRDHNVDFADCLHLATAYTYDQLPLKTFDKQASRVEGFEFLQ